MSHSEALQLYGSPVKIVINPVQSPEYQATESYSSLLVQDCPTF